MASRLCIVVCDNLKPELDAVLELEGYQDVISAGFTPICSHPLSEYDALNKTVKDQRDKDLWVHVIGGCCVSGFTGPARDRHYCRLSTQDHCSYFLAGEHLARHLIAQQAYLVTPVWLEQWRDFLEHEGFDRHTAREFFGECARKVVLLETGTSIHSTRNLQEFAEYINLPYESLPIGLDYFRLLIDKVVAEWRLASDRDTSVDTLAKAHKQTADCSVLLDMIGEMTGIATEEMVVQRILNLFTALCAPGKILYVPIVDGIPAEPMSLSTPVWSDADFSRWQSLHDDYAYTESGTGFTVLIKHQNEPQAILEVDQVAFPEFIDHYINMSINMAKVCGLAIANARTYKRLVETTNVLRESEERERNISGNLQGAMVPKIDVKIPGYSIAARYESSLAEAEVGGDFYDVFGLSDGRIAIVIGDVSGKGLAAAIHTAMAKHMLRAFAHENPSPSLVLERVNDAICDYLPSGMFVTMFYGILDPDTGKFLYANAGHDMPLLCEHLSGNVLPLSVSGLPVGVNPAVKYNEYQLLLSGNDSLVMYTDGITEARHGTCMFGIEGISNVLSAHCTDTCEEIISAVFDAAKAAGNGSLRDDAAVVVLRAADEP